MADLGVKKGNSKIKKHNNMMTPFAIQALPGELLVDIFAKVASRSIVDLCKVKLSCKDFLRAAEDDHVYHHASMENFALVPLPWFTSEGESSFLKRCRESGNLEISYREGMVEYFSYMEKVGSGIENLRKAAMDGHDDAKYVYCMILMCSEDEDERNKGFGILGCLKASTCITRCRKRVKCFVRSMWVNKNNPVLRRNQESSFCRSSASCETSVMMRNLSRRWLIQDEDNNNNNNNINHDDDNHLVVSCDYCLADYEVSLFRNMFEA